MPNDKADPVLSISALDIKEVLVCVSSLASGIIYRKITVNDCFAHYSDLYRDTDEMISFTLNNMWLCLKLKCLSPYQVLFHIESQFCWPKRNPCASTFLLSATRPEQKPKFSVNALIFKCCFFNIFCQVYFLYAVPVNSVKHV